MSSATLRLVDANNGTLDMLITYEGGFDPQLPSHAHVEALHRVLGQMAVAQGEAVHLMAAQVADNEASELD